MTDWIEHTTGTCPVDPEAVVEVRLRGGYVRPADKAGDMDWGSFWVASFRPPLGSPVLHPLDVTHYRIITPAPTPPLFLGGDPVKPPEPEMEKPEWIEHTTDTCPVDPETVVEVLLPGYTRPSLPCLATKVNWNKGAVAYYRIITPAKPPEPEMTKTHEDYTGPAFAMAIKPEPDLITLRLECLKLAATLEMAQILGAHLTLEQVADLFLHYVLNGSVDKA